MLRFYWYLGGEGEVSWSILKYKSLRVFSVTIHGSFSLS